MEKGRLQARCGWSVAEPNPTLLSLASVFRPPLISAFFSSTTSTPRPRVPGAPSSSAVRLHCLQCALKVSLYIIVRRPVVLRTCPPDFAPRVLRFAVRGTTPPLLRCIEACPPLLPVRLLYALHLLLAQPLIHAVNIYGGRRGCRSSSTPDPATFYWRFLSCLSCPTEVGRCLFYQYPFPACLGQSPINAKSIVTRRRWGELCSFRYRPVIFARNGRLSFF